MYRLRLTTTALAALAILISSSAYPKDRSADPQFAFHPCNGDLVFQTTKSQLGPAIEIATGSNITHVGMILIDNDTVFVYEAVGPVRRIPLVEWIDLGVENQFCVKRLKNAEEVLTRDVLKKISEVFSELEGRDYDIQFQWSDERLYCSELVHKMYEKGAGLELGEIEKFGDFHLDHPVVQFWINMYFPDGPDLDEKVVTPVSIYNDTSLVTIHLSYQETN